MLAGWQEQARASTTSRAVLLLCRLDLRLQGRRGRLYLSLVYPNPRAQGKVGEYLGYVGGRWVDIDGEEPGKKVLSQLRKKQTKVHCR